MARRSQNVRGVGFGHRASPTTLAQERPRLKPAGAAFDVSARAATRAAGHHRPPARAARGRGERCGREGPRALVRTHAAMAARASRRGAPRSTSAAGQRAVRVAGDAGPDGFRGGALVVNFAAAGLTSAARDDRGSVARPLLDQAPEGRSVPSMSSEGPRVVLG